MSRLPTALACLAICPVLAAQARLTPPPPSQAQLKARAFSKVRIRGKALRRDLSKLGRLRWHKSLRAAARDAHESGKPILWIHALGSFKGYT